MNRPPCRWSSTALTNCGEPSLASYRFLGIYTDLCSHHASIVAHHDPKTWARVRFYFPTTTQTQEATNG